MPSMKRLGPVSYQGVMAPRKQVEQWVLESFNCHATRL